MSLSKKYGAVALLGVLAIVAANGANISDFLSGIVTGFAAALMVYALYKMSVALKDEKKGGNNLKKSA
ncbi:hypothetical protein [Butyrivibrio sp. VCD2006]|uniref:hypothetical protein n=1 Tax=Butyrivibrio sp. VCD2006 TaxID=1280664 RepID=UPI000403F8A5|nr:hypothetical protein [Butyrivibrio sp. VCD2006]